MTRISNDNQSVQRPERVMPHWLVFTITLLALSAPIGALLFTAWLAVVRPADLIVSAVELAYIGVATILIGTAMAAYVHRGRGERSYELGTSPGAEGVARPQQER